jgi:hypothetical protein
MESWGWNPATVEAVATSLTVIVIFLTWLLFRESKAQRKSLEDEISSRMRPWVGLFDLQIKKDDTGALGAEKLTLFALLRNFGPIPAQNARLKINIAPRMMQAHESPNPVNAEEPEPKALMPSEDGRYTIGLDRYPQIESWLTAQRDLTITGVFEYSLAGKKFESRFEGTVWFSRPWTGDTAPMNWRNVSAT